MGQGKRLALNLPQPHLALERGCGSHRESTVSKQCEGIFSFAILKTVLLSYVRYPISFLGPEGKDPGKSENICDFHRAGLTSNPSDIISIGFRANPTSLPAPLERSEGI